MRLRSPGVSPPIRLSLAPLAMTTPSFALGQRGRAARVCADIVALHPVARRPRSCSCTPYQPLPLMTLPAPGSCFRRSGCRLAPRHDRDADSAIAERLRARDVGADVVTLDFVGCGAGALHENPVLSIAADNVARSGRFSAHHVAAGAVDQSDAIDRGYRARPCLSRLYRCSCPAPGCRSSPGPGATRRR